MNDDQLVIIGESELSDLLADAHMSGRHLAVRTCYWLEATWNSLCLPVNRETGRPYLSADMMLHAGAVTSIMLWEEYRFNESVRLHIITAEDAFHGFIDRARSRDVNRYFSDEGYKLSSAVQAFEQCFILPSEVYSPDSGQPFALKVQDVDDQAIDLLAQLLFDFRNILNSTDVSDTND